MQHTKEQGEVNFWLASIGSKMNQEFKLNEDGIFALDYKSEWRLTIEVPKESDRFYLYGPLASLDGVEDSPLLKKALILNLFQLETAGGTLAYDKVSSEIIFSFIDTIQGKNAEMFEQCLNSFIQTAQSLKIKLEEAEVNPETVATKHEASTLMMPV